MNRITPAQLIAAAQVVCGQERDRYATKLHGLVTSPHLTPDQRDTAYLKLMRERQDLVFDIFLNGAAMTLKLLHGDGYPEPYERSQTHTDRLRDLLTQFGLIALPPGSPVPEPSSVTSSTQKIGE